MQENLFYSVFGTILGWIPHCYIWLRNRFTSIGATGITFFTRPHNRPDQAQFKCKIHIDITNRRRGPVRISRAYFVFDKGCILRPDPIWASEHGSGHFLLPFFTPQTKQHDWPDVYLRPNENTDIWIGVDPQLADSLILEAATKKSIGRLYFQMTEWSDLGNPKTRWVRVKI